MNVQLGVNIDHIATLRQARRGIKPDPIQAALDAELSGADSIVCHLREDRRHMQDADVVALHRQLHTYLNLEMSITQDIVDQAVRVCPRQVTLVPERREELTTEGGLDVVRRVEPLTRVIRQLTAAGIVVSLFIDPDERQISCAQQLGVPMVELHTGRFAEMQTAADIAREYRILVDAAQQAHQCGLRVAAGHGLEYHHAAQIASIPHIEELNIGFSIVARAVMDGWVTAVREMAHIIHEQQVADGAQLRC
jgi:pyridoxine 5-phosphate synthase